jgi:heme-degrading monooxygenase HmoA
MSVIVITHVPADVNDFQRVADANPDVVRGIAEEARGKGALHHSFVEGEDGQVMIIDEWQTAEAFDEFFANQPDIARRMGEASLAGAPSTARHRVIETGDRF